MGNTCIVYKHIKGITFVVNAFEDVADIIWIANIARYAGCGTWILCFYLLLYFPELFYR